MDENPELSVECKDERFYVQSVRDDWPLQTKNDSDQSPNERVCFEMPRYTIFALKFELLNDFKNNNIISAMGIRIISIITTHNKPRTDFSTLG